MVKKVAPGTAAMRGQQTRALEGALSKGAANDGWMNVLTGLGRMGKDHTVGTRARRPRLLRYRELAWIYAGDGVGGTISDCIPDDAMKDDFGFTGDSKEEMLFKKCSELGLPEAVRLACKWRRAFGGALVVADFVNDNTNLEEPVSEGAQVRKFRVYPASRVDVASCTFNTDTSSENFDEIEVFAIRRLRRTSADIEGNGGYIKVHRSRCYAMKGIPVPEIESDVYTADQAYWGMSAVQRPYESLKIFGSFFQGIGHMGGEMVIGKYRISNLEKLLLTNDFKAIKERIEIMQLSKSVVNAIFLGKDEEFTRDSLSFAGVSDVIDRMMMAVSGSTGGIPVTRLFGRSAGGENATGEGDARNYDDMVRSEQKTHAGPCIVWGAKLVDRSEHVVTDGDYEVEFAPVYSPTLKELITMRYTQQQTDSGYINDGVLDPLLDVRASRFQGGYSFDTRLDADAKPVRMGSMQTKVAATDPNPIGGAPVLPIVKKGKGGQPAEPVPPKLGSKNAASTTKPVHTRKK